MYSNDFINYSTPSLYQPDEKVSELTQYAKQVYDQGHRVLNQSYPELNDRSIIEDERIGKKIWNAYVDESTPDPFEAWKWQGTRSEARKRGVAMHAQLTAGFLFAGISAQDEDDKEDRAAGDFMRGLVEWMAENSDYTSSFIQVTMGMLMNPISYLGAEYAEVMQKVREKVNNGWKVSEVLDEEFSGFRAPVYGSTDIMVTNPYLSPFNFQRQTCVIKNRYLDYSDAKKKYGNHPNFEYVQRGLISVFNEIDGLFYDVKDDENPNLVKETICSWRGDDLEIPYLNGVYMGNENTEWNPMKHRDLKNNPKYNVTPFGYGLISEHFFAYKSLMNTLQWEDSFYDEFSRNVLNKELLDLIPPTVSVGDEEGVVKTSTIFPGAHVTAKSKDFDIRSILPPSSGNRYAALSEVKKSMEDLSISDVQSGQLPEASQKATAIIQSTLASKTLLRGVGRTMGQSIVAYTRLMVDIAVRYLSIVQVQEITGGMLKDRYRQFMLPNRISKGKRIGKVLRFNGDFVGKEMGEKEKKMYEIGLSEETGYPDSKSEIIEMNPEMAARMKYLISFDPEEMFSQNQQQMQVMLQNMYAQLRADPLIDPEALLREYMYAFFRSKGDDFINPNGMKQLQQRAKQHLEGGQKMPTPVASPVGMV